MDIELPEDMAGNKFSHLCTQNKQCYFSPQNLAALLTYFAQ